VNSTRGKRRAWFNVLLIALLPLAAQSAWINATGKPLSDTESMRSAADFGVQIVLTANVMNVPAGQRLGALSAQDEARWQATADHLLDLWNAG
jgi:hypothetical protein